MEEKKESQKDTKTSRKNEEIIHFIHVIVFLLSS